MRDDPLPATSLPRRAEVAVVGGGIAGTSAAYHLARAGLDVTLLERKRVGEGATGAAVGILAPPLRQPFHETARFLGAEAAAEIWRFALRSVAGLAGLLEERDASARTGLDLRGGYVLAEPHTQHDLERACEALVSASLPVECLSADKVRAVTRGRGFTGGFRIDGLGALRPEATARALALAAADLGATIVQEAAVQGVGKNGDLFDVATTGGSLEAKHVVYAAHIDSGRLAPHLAREVVPVRGQGFVTAPMPIRFRGAFATHWKLNVWRQDPAGRLLVSGWRHDAWERSYRETAELVDTHLQGDLQRWFEAAFPDLAPLEIEHRWSGVFGWTADFLPIVGRLPDSPNELASTGFSGGGLPFAFECGRILAHTLADLEPVPGAALFDPARFSQRQE